MFIRCFFFLVLGVCPIAATAVEIVALVSPRNTADVLSGAHQFLADNPSHKIHLRTTDQFVDMADEQRKQLLSSADIVFVGGVFGDSVTLLKSYIASEGNASIRSFVAVHSDRFLVRASRVLNRSMLNGADLDVLMQDPPAKAGLDVMAWSRSHLQRFPQHHDWLLAKTFWADRDSNNINGLFRHLTTLAGETLAVDLPRLKAPLQIYINDRKVDPESLVLADDVRWVAIIDYETGTRPGEKKLIDDLCRQIKSRPLGEQLRQEGQTSLVHLDADYSKIECLRVFAKWGPSSVRASEILAQHRTKISAVISLQNFVLGGGEGRTPVNEALAALNVPVLKGLRLSDSTADEYRLSEEGLRWDTVHYRVAMPELQGISQPLVLAAMTEASIDRRTGVKLALSSPLDSQVSLMARRVKRWIALQTKKNKDKRVAIIYYNHPPGRHNIGADNLNVPESLLEILQHLKHVGYDTGKLPATREALLDILQDRGVNLPENRKALSALATKVDTVSAAQYQKWFNQLPKLIRDEMEYGPLGYLHVSLKMAIHLEDPDISERLVNRIVVDLKHAMEGADHKARDRVIDLLDQLLAVYHAKRSEHKTEDNKQIDWEKAEEIVEAIADSGIEGVRGWGKAPGKVMVHEGKLLIPGVQFGNIFVGPQPPRGWELNEEILHANFSFPPPHQYIAFYQWLRHSFAADALVHLGRHSTYEFLPRHRVGMSEVDYPTALIDDLPSVYPYIVDGVGEGIQAKRRGLAVMVDHLTPPLDSTELYDRLLALRQLVESYEAAPESAGAMRHRAIVEIKALVDELKLADELTESMAGELEVRGVEAYDEVDDELLVHEVGHYLTKLQEDFMPLGLHTFGQSWSDEAVRTMLNSMAKGEAKGSKDEEAEGVFDRWQELLVASPKAEIAALEQGLAGAYVQPGKGNDPIRTPEVLPTGRNFFALDGGLIPSRLGYQVGVDLAVKARSLETVKKRQNTADEKNTTAQSDAIVLWASDVVRDEGAMIAFGFDMLGVKPVWSSRGIVKRLERLDIATLEENGKPRIRHDTLYTTSGLFRDLYGAHIIWLERAVLMALDASSDEIRVKYPALSLALNAALHPLGKNQNPGREPLAINQVASRWVEDARLAMQQGHGAEDAGRSASYRIFGDAPGTYGAGVNRLVERSGSWDERADIAKVYIRRMGHAYGANLHGQPQQELFTQRLGNVGKTYLGRSSNLYGLLDNNDTFDYLGGLSLAVETVKGQVPQNFILSHQDSANIAIEPLSVALLSELRSRFLNPQWLNPLMEEGYAGARTMGSEFFEYLWGWQVTNPEVVKNWVWDEVKSVYIDDRYGIGLDVFLERDHNVHVKSNMLAVMLVAAQKQFWDADQKTLEQLSNAFADLVLENGLPGSGHTSPDNPVFDFLASYIDQQKFAQLQSLLNSTRITPEALSAPSTISELNAAREDMPSSESASLEEKEHSDSSLSVDYRWWILLFILLVVAGIVRGARPPKSVG